MSLSRRYFKLFIVLLLLLAPLAVEAQKKEKVASAPVLTEDMLKNFIRYRSIGPTRQSGRFVDLAVPGQEPYIFYAATGSGGLWKTTNNGLTFTPIFDYENVFSIGDIDVAATDAKIVWIGTGEANSSRSTYWGDGVYKSVDAGKTWTNMGLKESHHIARLVIHPANPDIVYVAALGHLYSENPDRGLYKTTDGGATWKKVLDISVNGKSIGAVEVVIDPKNPETVYAATYDRHRTPWTYMVGGIGSGIYKTTDGGANWKKLENGLPSGVIGRIGLTIYPKNPNILYACVENTNKPGMSVEARLKEIIEGKSSQGMIDGEVFRTDDGGETWRKVSPEKQSIGGAPGYYYGQIVVDPNDDLHVYVLSVGMFETKDGGKTWGVPFRFGGDNHALWINPNDSNHMLLGYDHGMGVTYDGGKTWFHTDHLPLAQFYAVDFDMSIPYRVAGGLQDNGSVMGPNTRRGGGPVRLEDWFTVGGGDGMYNVFDKKTNRYLYNESQFGPLQRIDLLTGETKSIAYQNKRRDLRWNWCSPVIVSSHNSDVIYQAGNIVVRSAFRGETWEEISPDLTTNDPTKLTTGKGGDGNIQYCTITALDESPLVEGLLWAGTDDGNVWVTKDAGKNWTKLNDKIIGNSGYWVSRIIASHHHPGTAYISYTGYRQDDFRPFLYKTTDYGETWTSVAANLPREPINVIREHHKNPNLLFVGTEFAVHVSADGGKSWVRMKANMPTQPVHDLKLHPRENDIIVATHGRGIFIADISALAELTPQLLAKDAHLFAPESKIRWMRGLNSHSSTINYSGESEPAAILINYYLKGKAAGDVKVAVYKGEKFVHEVKGAGAAGFNQVAWNMVMRVRERTEQEKKAFQAQMERFAQFAGLADMEVLARRFGMGGGMDPDYITAPAPVGEYRFVLTVGAQQLAAWASILDDPAASEIK